MTDQAATLRDLVQHKHSHHGEASKGKSKIITLLSGKGGVGKSWFSIQFSYDLTRKGYRTLVVDTNLYTPSLHVLTNTSPTYTLHQLLSTGKGISEEHIITLEENLHLLPNEAPESLQDNKIQDKAMVFLAELQPLMGNYDYIILDSKTGLDTWNMELTNASDDVLLLSLNEPTSIIDTYLLLKAAKPYLSVNTFSLLITQVFNQQSGEEAHQKLNQALSHFLDFRIPLLGVILFDYSLKMTITEQEAFWNSPACEKSSRSVDKIVISYCRKMSKKSILKDEEAL